MSEREREREIEREREREDGTFLLRRVKNQKCRSVNSTFVLGRRRKKNRKEEGERESIVNCEGHRGMENIPK